MIGLTVTPKMQKMDLFEMVDTPLSRYARILEAVASDPAGMTLSSIAEHTGLQLATSHRLVNSLCSVGFLTRQEPARIYVLGARMIQLALLTVTPNSVVDAARPILQNLVTTFGETSYLAKLNGTAVESVAMETPRMHDKSFVQPGRIMPIHATASGKVLCAFQTPDFIDRFLAQPRTRFTANTIISERELRKELKKVLAQRFAVCDNELDPGVLSYAVPVYVEPLGVRFALGLQGLSSQFRETPGTEIVERLRLASEVLSRRISAASPPSGGEPATAAPVQQARSAQAT